MTAVAVLFIAPGSAVAECAWVLWQQVVQIGVRSSDETWTILRTYDARPACFADLVTLLHPDSAWRVMYQPFGADTVIKKNGTVHETKRALCVPGTLDPRGPKGK